MDEDTVLVALVNPAAAVLSDSSTIAMTYDCLAGTSISDKDCLHRRRKTALSGVGAKATAIRKKLEGM
jgi:hypothetical protein